MKLAYLIFLRELGEMFLFHGSFLKLAFILSLSALVNFIKAFQISMHILELLKPSVGGVIPVAFRRKKTSTECSLNSLSIGCLQPSNFNKCHRSLNYTFFLLIE